MVGKSNFISIVFMIKKNKLLLKFKKKNKLLIKNLFLHLIN